jgi:hypothetical protein
MQGIVNVVLCTVRIELMKKNCYYDRSSNLAYGTFTGIHMKVLEGQECTKFD